MTTILLVEDYAPNHRLLSFVLEQSGYAVVCALDGIQALECLNAMPIDLIITDLTMPRLDGFGLVERVRADPRFRELPVIVVTASGKEADAIRAAGVGINAFLTKPVDSEDLARAVAQLLARETLQPGMPWLKLQSRAA
ncbi:MAG: response regulator [Chloroflexi bacterium]|nr:response regulator [Chloroflexota bacterium]